MCRICRIIQRFYIFDTYTTFRYSRHFLRSLKIMLLSSIEIVFNENQSWIYRSMEKKKKINSVEMIPLFLDVFFIDQKKYQNKYIFFAFKLGNCGIFFSFPNYNDITLHHHVYTTMIHGRKARWEQSRTILCFFQIRTKSSHYFTLVEIIWCRQT